MTINDLKPLTSKSTYNEMKQNFDILYMYSEYSEDFLLKLSREYFISPASTKYHGSHKHGLLLHSVNVSLIAYKNLIEMKKANVSNKLDSMSEDEFNQYLKDVVFVGLFHDLVKVGKYVDEEDATEKQIEYALGLCKELNLESDLFDIMNLGKKSIGSFIEKAKQLLYDLNNDKIDENNFIKRANELSLIKREYDYDKNTIDIGHSEQSLVRILQNGVILTDDMLIAIRYHMDCLDPLYQVEIERKKILNYMNTIPMLKSIVLAEKISGFTLESSGY